MAKLLNWMNEDWQIDRPDKEARNYWDEHLENNPIRIKRETSAGAFLAWMLEAAGDILREMGQNYQDPGYIGEKVNRLKHYQDARDWGLNLSDEEENYRVAMAKQISKIPIGTKSTKAIKELIMAVIGRNKKAVAENVAIVEKLLLPKRSKD
jgi:hypothetical protein